LQLAKAAEDIQERLKTGELNLSALRNQLATAQIIHGAIYSAKARRAEVTGSPLAHTALSFYRQALSVPEHDSNVLAKECEAHELRKLGQFAQALNAYKGLENISAKSNDYRSQRLLIAKAKRYQALVIQAECSALGADGERIFGASVVAHQKLLRDPDSAIAMRANFAPYQDFELIEQGDLHYTEAFVAHNNGFVVIENNQLDLAESCYQAVSALSPSTWRDRKRARQLKLLAEEGIARVADAKPKGENEGKKYNWRWLLAN
jgi:tetratricopeptide (TPR) repeat protein